jgi:hypothetical protein
MGGITIEAELQHGINFSQPSFFDLRTHKPDKTIDIGRDGLSLSLDAKGRVTSPLDRQRSMLITYQGVAS